MSSLTLLGKIIASCILLAIACAALAYYEFKATHPEITAIACTTEAMQCPDGSWVGRTGPNCMFICPAATTTISTSTPISVNSTTTTTVATTTGGAGIAAYKSGIRGTVAVGPTCPVERTPPDPACATKAFKTTIAIFKKTDPVHAFVLTQSDAKGAFEASLPPGIYMVGAGESALPRCAQVAVTVDPTKYSSISIVCDSGIR